MVETEEYSNAGTDADTTKDCLVHTLLLANRKDIIAHVLEGKLAGGFVGPPITPDVKRNDPEGAGEMADLVHPEIVVKRIGVDHDKREAFPGDFVIDLYPIGYAVRQWPFLLRMIYLQFSVSARFWIYPKLKKNNI
jgi:hypothetical protein